jgi:glycosyltransferase involved in cell wall biosynthesis
MEILIHQVAARTADLGHRVTVLAPNKGLDTHDLPYRLWPVRGLGPLSPLLPVQICEWFYLLQLLLAHRALSFDVLHCHALYPTGYIGAMFERRTKVPLVTTSQGGDFHGVREIGYGLGLNPDPAPKIRQAIRAARAVTCVSRMIRDRAVSYGIPSDRLFDIANGVDLEWFDSLEDLSLPEEMASIPSSARLLLSVGRNHPKKRLEDVIRAFAYIAGQYDDLFCIIVGHGVPSLEPLVRELAVERRVYLLEQIPKITSHRWSPDMRFPARELLAIYKRGHIFALPSLAEGFALVIAEAMAAGLPVITTDVPGNNDIVRHGENGFLVPVRSPQALAEQIGRLLDDPQLHARMSANARGTAAGYDWNEITRKYLEVYERVLGA